MRLEQVENMLFWWERSVEKYIVFDRKKKIQAKICKLEKLIQMNRTISVDIFTSCSLENNS